jgi:hypothetical protein
MAEYLRAVWGVSAILVCLAVAVVCVMSLVAVLFSGEILAILPCIWAALAGFITLLSIRLSLEVFAVIFDIRGLLRRQEAQLHEQIQLLRHQISQQ